MSNIELVTVIIVAKQRNPTSLFLTHVDLVFVLGVKLNHVPFVINMGV